MSGLDLYNTKAPERRAQSESRKKLQDLDDDKSLKNESLLSASTAAKSYATESSPEVVRTDSMLRYRKKRQDIYGGLHAEKHSKKV